VFGGGGEGTEGKKTSTVTPNAWLRLQQRVFASLDVVRRFTAQGRGGNDLTSCRRRLWGEKEENARCCVSSSTGRRASLVVYWQRRSGFGCGISETDSLRNPTSRLSLTTLLRLGRNIVANPSILLPASSVSPQQSQPLLAEPTGCVLSSSLPNSASSANSSRNAACAPTRRDLFDSHPECARKPQGRKCSWVVSHLSGIILPYIMKVC